MHRHRLDPKTAPLGCRRDVGERQHLRWKKSINVSERAAVGRERETGRHGGRRQGPGTARKGRFRNSGFRCATDRPAAPCRAAVQGCRGSQACRRSQGRTGTQTGALTGRKDSWRQACHGGGSGRQIRSAAVRACPQDVYESPAGAAGGPRHLRLLTHARTAAAHRQG